MKLIKENMKAFGLWMRIGSWLQINRLQNTKRQVNGRLGNSLSPPAIHSFPRSLPYPVMIVILYLNVVLQLITHARQSRLTSLCLSIQALPSQERSEWREADKVATLNIFLIPVLRQIPREAVTRCRYQSAQRLLPNSPINWYFFFLIIRKS